MDLKLLVDSSQIVSHNMDSCSNCELPNNSQAYPYQISFLTPYPFYPLPYNTYINTHPVVPHLILRSTTYSELTLDIHLSSPHTLIWTLKDKPKWG